MMNSDLYELLGVSRNASPAVIEAAYRAMVRELNSEVNKMPDVEVRFKEVEAAFQLLSDPALRAKYDRQTSRAQSQLQTPNSVPVRRAVQVPVKVPDSTTKRDRPCQVASNAPSGNSTRERQLRLQRQRANHAQRNSTKPLFIALAVTFVGTILIVIIAPSHSSPAQVIPSQNKSGDSNSNDDIVSAPSADAPSDWRDFGQRLRERASERNLKNAQRFAKDLNSGMGLNFAINNQMGRDGYSDQQTMTTALLPYLQEAEASGAVPVGTTAELLKQSKSLTESARRRRGLGVDR